MAKDNARAEAARTAYRAALEAARTNPTPEAWARLLAAGKALGSATETKPRSRRRRNATVAAEVIAADGGAATGERPDAERDTETFE